MMVSFNDSISGFFLLGFSDLHGWEDLLALFLLIIYIMATVSNLLILCMILANPFLHTPMYFFLGNLSILDIAFISVTIPKMLRIFLTNDRYISYVGCLVQLYFYVCLEGTEAFLLAFMAYDRYVAICSPMYYQITMNTNVCIALAIISWLFGNINALVHTTLTFTLPFCRSHDVNHLFSSGSWILGLLYLPYCDDNKINHFFCEIMPLLKLACADTYLNEIVVFTSDFILGICCFLLICISYILIIKVVLKIRSAEGKSKAFSTCASHVTIVSMYYGAVIFTYIRPRSSLSLERDKIVSALYAVFTPTLNPIVYSLRNKEVKESFRKVIKRFSHFMLFIYLLLFYL
uniref:Olfactory receptor n=1 Tax=Leptobrachium leishanense TaxID=445787 RepID=A0A8C5QM75_9ANUR